ncbi:hypothetical protein VIBNISO65_1290009 [Vibrio nigripulchritudo SO65]|nr:hypothetical protein VIBNISO65_1290009 [Vibrio nigripulchritudo SO65]
MRSAIAISYNGQKSNRALFGKNRNNRCIKHKTSNILRGASRLPCFFLSCPHISHISRAKQKVNKSDYYRICTPK